MLKISRVDKYLDCIVCHKKVKRHALPEEDETVCVDCLPVYQKALSKYLKYLDAEEAKEKEAIENGTYNGHG